MPQPSDPTEVSFPAASMREEFIDQIELWNRIEDLPKIEVYVSADGRTLSYRCADYRRAGLRKLARAYGGRVYLEAATADPQEGAA